MEYIVNKRVNENRVKKMRGKFKGFVFKEKGLYF